MQDPSSVTAAQLRTILPDLSEAAASYVLQTAPAGYSSRFSIAQIAQHALSLSRLSRTNPFVVDVHPLENHQVSVTVIAFDFPGEFAVLAGYLGSTGFDIQSGAAYTFQQEQESYPKESNRNRRATQRKYFGPFGPRADALLPTTRIVDSFTGRLNHVSTETWEHESIPRLERYLSLLFQNTAESRDLVKQEVNEAVAAALQDVDTRYSQTLYPVQISVSSKDPSCTTMSVVSEDTPFFLFALSNALAIQGISIRRVQIHTKDRQVEDEFDFVDSMGKPVQDEAILNRIKLSVLFTKQFTYFLNQAPDPYRALLRFESLTEDALSLSNGQQLEQTFTNPRMLHSLARLLGASDFLWEDFLRLQYETILPMIEPADRGHTLSSSRKDLPGILSAANEELNKRAGQSPSASDRWKILNDFKDRQSYLVDVDHILNPELDFFFLSRRLTGIAELVLRSSVDISLAELSPEFGVPRTVAGLPARFAIFGLGKLGGAALGYASDVEVLFVYSDNGQTDGPKQIPNAEFFERVFGGAVNGIETRREGIFQVDLRLRPHGNAGPVACSMENFIRYYAPGGEAHSYERLALVRLRWIGGDEELGRQIERIRDDFVYAGSGIDLTEIRDLRKIQLSEKTGTGKLNAKFSPGALVDLEYSVQILQVMHGKGNPDLRTSRIHRALEALAAAGTIEDAEAQRIIGAYRFLRNLINGLRMLRGNAKDLFLPEVGSPEYMHLARRMGYEGHDDLNAAEELHIEFETRTAAIRAFVESRLGRDALPGPRAISVADIVLSDSLEEDEVLRVLAEAGFSNPHRSYGNLRSLADAGHLSPTGSRPVRERFAEVAVLAWDMLPNTPDPDMALNNWDLLVHTLEDPEAHLRGLLSQPKRLELLLQIMAGSQFLADTLIANPDFFSWATSPHTINALRTREILESELRDIAALSAADRPSWLKAIRRFRKREILRIGTRDICLGADIRSIVSELSNLACATIQVALEYLWGEQPPSNRSREKEFCVLAFGKLGGRELNYSSDVDLLGIYRQSNTAPQEEEIQLFSRVMEQLRSDLSDHNEEGYAYRVDLRLRPYGSSGRLVYSVPSIVRYYNESASAWEYQALLKLTPIAGNQEIGWNFLETIKPAFLATWDRERILRTIRDMRNASRRKATSRLSGRDVKSGRGGIRDIEFTVQGLQLIHSREHPELLTGNTLTGIERLAKLQLISSRTVHILSRDYVFLRRVEHFLQIYEDRQVHTLPTSEDARRALALRCAGFSDEPQGPDASNGSDASKGLAGAEDPVSRFFQTLEDTFERVHEVYESVLFGDLNEKEDG